jgi:hypothetical protein
MDNQEIKKSSRWILLIWLVIAAGFAGGTFLILSAAPKSNGAEGTLSETNPASSSATDIEQSFSGNGYALSLPSDWYVEQTGKDSMAAYPDHSVTTGGSTTTAPCKIEMTVFPPVADDDTAQWISDRIGADPSVSAVERSSSDIAIVGGSGVEWNGTIDGVPNTIVYAFSASHAFEIAPSVVNDATGAGNAECSDALEKFISQLTLQ